MPRRTWYAEEFGYEDPDEFWTAPEVIQAYKEHAAFIMSRRNTVTGVTYGNDPTVFSWNLINEVRRPLQPLRGGPDRRGLALWASRLVHMSWVNASSQSRRAGPDWARHRPCLTGRTCSPRRCVGVAAPAQHQQLQARAPLPHLADTRCCAGPL